MTSCRKDARANYCVLQVGLVVPVGRAKMSSPAGSPKGGGYVGLAGNRRQGGSSPMQKTPSRGSSQPGRRMLGGSHGASTPRPSPEELTPRNSNGQPVPPQAPAAPLAPGTRPAIVISGCTGKYKLINDTYEPLQMSHQTKPCWKARSSAPVYLFHTGKSRWVISKRINVGMLSIGHAIAHVNTCGLIPVFQVAQAGFVAFLCCHFLVGSDRVQEFFNDALSEHLRRAHQEEEGPALEQPPSLLQRDQGTGLKVAMTSAAVRRHQDQPEKGDKEDKDDKDDEKDKDDDKDKGEKEHEKDTKEDEEKADKKDDKDKDDKEDDKKDKEEDGKEEKKGEEGKDEEGKEKDKDGKEEEGEKKGDEGKEEEGKEKDKDGKEKEGEKKGEEGKEEEGKEKDKDDKEGKEEEGEEKDEKTEKDEKEDKGQSDDKEEKEEKKKDEDQPESFDTDLGVPVPNVPEMPSTMFSKLKAELASDGPVETSIRETDEAGDETMKDAKEWRETEKELQQATEDLGKASHKALDEEDSASFCKPVCCPGRSGSDRSAGRNAETTEGTVQSCSRHRKGDGQRCYAFVSDNGAPDPTQCPGQWMCCGEDGSWVKDENIKCVTAKASNDQFTMLRSQVEEDLAHYGLMDDKSLKQMWRKLDSNGNNVVSLAEIDALVIDMTKAGLWPDWLNNKDSIRRAYEKTIKCLGSDLGVLGAFKWMTCTPRMDGDDDDWVEKEEFHALLLNLFWFGHLHQIFDQLDTSHDGRLSLEEFTAGMAAKEFQSIDLDHGGMVLFTEFCAYVRRRVQPDHNPAFDADIVTKDKSSDTLRKKHGDKATHGQFVQKKTLAEFDKLEKEIKDILKANDQGKLSKMWKRLDFNGNNIVSLAEVDKLANEQFPLLNHKPALMRAFQATLRAGNGDEWVQKHEFKMLLGNLFYFNKLFWLFEQAQKRYSNGQYTHELESLVFGLQLGSCCGRSFSGACRCVASKCHSQRSRRSSRRLMSMVAALFSLMSSADTSLTENALKLCRISSITSEHDDKDIVNAAYFTFTTALRLLSIWAFRSFFSCIRLKRRAFPNAPAMLSALVSNVALASQSTSRALQIARRSLHRAPGLPYKIYQPHVQEPEHTIKIQGQPTGLARYIPKHFRHQQFIESTRSGEFCGPDWPYNNLGGTFWKERRYNVTYNPIPPDSSVMPGVHFFARLNVWAVEWWEQDRHRIRWFRAHYGFMRAKQSAEDFRKQLIQAGRVDNCRTDREIRIQQLARAESRKLFKKKFNRKDARRLGNSGTKQGNERKARREYQKRGLLP
eukprot:symbB.v1.2.018884.t1/scaffold1500.1/size115144/8